MSFMMDIMDSIWVPVITLNVMALGGVVAVAVGTSRGSSRTEDWQRKTYPYNYPPLDSSTPDSSTSSAKDVVPDLAQEELKLVENPMLPDAIEKGKKLEAAVSGHGGSFDDIYRGIKGKIDSIVDAYTANDAPVFAGEMPIETFVFKTVAGPMVKVDMSLAGIDNEGKPTTSIKISLQGWSEGRPLPAALSSPERKKEIIDSVFDLGIVQLLEFKEDTILRKDDHYLSETVDDLEGVLRKVGALGMLDRINVMKLESAEFKDSGHYFLFVGGEEVVSAIKKAEEELNTAESEMEIAEKEDKKAILIKSEIENEFGIMNHNSELREIKGTNAPNDQDEDADEDEDEDETAVKVATGATAAKEAQVAKQEAQVAKKEAQVAKKEAQVAKKEAQVAKEVQVANEAKEAKEAQVAKDAKAVPAAAPPSVIGGSNNEKSDFNSEKDSIMSIHVSNTGDLRTRINKYKYEFNNKSSNKLNAITIQRDKKKRQINKKKDEIKVLKGKAKSAKQKELSNLSEELDQLTKRSTEINVYKMQAAKLDEFLSKLDRVDHASERFEECKKKREAAYKTRNKTVIDKTNECIAYGISFREIPFLKECKYKVIDNVVYDDKGDKIHELWSINNQEETKEEEDKTKEEEDEKFMITEDQSNLLYTYNPELDERIRNRKFSEYDINDSNYTLQRGNIDGLLDINGFSKLNEYCTAYDMLFQAFVEKFRDIKGVDGVIKTEFEDIKDISIIIDENVSENCWENAISDAELEFKVNFAKSAMMIFLYGATTSNEKFRVRLKEEIDEDDLKSDHEQLMKKYVNLIYNSISLSDSNRTIFINIMNDLKLSGINSLFKDRIEKIPRPAEEQV